MYVNIVAVLLSCNTKTTFTQTGTQAYMNVTEFTLVSPIIVEFYELQTFLFFIHIYVRNVDVFRQRKLLFYL